MRIDTMESGTIAALMTLALRGVKARRLSYSSSYEEQVSESLWTILRVESDGRVQIEFDGTRVSVNPAYLRREP